MIHEIQEEGSNEKIMVESYSVVIKDKTGGSLH